MKKLLLLVMVAFAAGVATAEASVTINEVRMLDPWDGAKGAITIDYTLAGLEAGTPYKVAFGITADGRTVSVTNGAAMLSDGRQPVQTNDTAVLFGGTVADKDATVKVRLIAMRRIPGVQLWENGAFFAESNLGATNPEDYGSLYDFHVAQAAVSGAWHTPTSAELGGLVSECDRTWDGARSGWIFKGKGDYSSNSIFLPAAGKSTTRDGAGSIGYYWSTSIADERNGYHLYLNHNTGETDCRTADIYGVFNGMSVRQARSASSPSWEESAEVTDKMTFMLGMATVALPTGTTGYRYVVSNTTARAEIKATEGGRYALPLGARVAVYAVPEAGYVIVGTNPYVIEQVTLDMTIDESMLPKVSPAVKINEVKSIDTWDGEKGPVAVDYSLAGLNTNLEYKVAFDITAGGRTVSVTNAAARRFDGRQTVVTNDTAALFGEVVVTDDAVMKLSLIAQKPKTFETPECEEVVESTSEKPFLLGMAEIVLPTGMIVYDYAVSNLTDAAEIAPRAEGRYALPLGARVAVYAVAEEGYAIVGTNPYVIEKVTSDTAVDVDQLPRVSPTVILRNVETFGPWDGKKGVVAVDYSLAGLEADRWYKVAFEITADGLTVGVTNLEAKLPEGKQELKLIETVPLFGKETVDKDAVVKLSLIAVNPIPEGQLWIDGPVGAESNLGESEVADHPEYGALYDFDNAVNVVSELGDGWRLPTGDELAKLIDESGASVCTRKWDDDRKGWTFTGAGAYSSNSIFLPAAGFGVGGSRSQAGAGGIYRSSSSESPDSAQILLFDRSDAALGDYDRSIGGSVRVVKEVGSGSEIVKSSDEAVFRLGPKEVYYRDYDPETGTFTNASRQCTLVTSGTRILFSGWYAVEGAVDFSGNACLGIFGDAHLILCDGASLTITNRLHRQAAVTVTGIDGLTIYGQLEGSGRLTVSGGANNAGIGGYSGTSGTRYDREDPQDCGKVTINGGTVTATGGMYGAGIGGSCDADGGKVTINGGTVTATGGYGAAGIGCARKRTKCAVTVTGGRVTARKGGDGSLADDIGYGECTGTVKKEGAIIKLSGGVFWRKPKDEWTIQSCRVVPNMDDATAESYPWRVVVSNTVVSPEYPLGPFDTAAEATNAMASAEFAPDSNVAVELGIGSAALADYCSKFGLDVVLAADGKWSVAALLKPEPWTNVVLSAQAATRQIPVADIAKLGLGVETNVTVGGCVPGFYYSFYSGNMVTNVRAIVSEDGRNVLCGTDEEVTFSGVTKPSDEAGFFRVGADATRGIAK